MGEEPKKPTPPIPVPADEAAGKDSIKADAEKERKEADKAAAPK